MHPVETRQEVARHLQKPAVFAISFFVSATAILLLAAFLAWLVAKTASTDRSWNQAGFVALFALSTILLTAGSVQLARASMFVKIERQTEFRRCLAGALLVGTAFIGVQSCALALLVGAPGMDLATQVRQAAFAFIFLHAIHVTVAVFFVLFVFLRANADRYDHEYSWGVTFCGWFWHGLGVVWMAIVVLFIVAGSASLVQ